MSFVFAKIWQRKHWYCIILQAYSRGMTTMGISMAQILAEQMWRVKNKCFPLHLSSYLEGLRSHDNSIWRLCSDAKLYFVILYFFFAFLLLEPGYHMHCKDNVIKVRFLWLLMFKDTVIFILVSVTKSTSSTMTGTKY